RCVTGAGVRDTALLLLLLLFTSHVVVVLCLSVGRHASRRGCAAGVLISLGSGRGIDTYGNSYPGRLLDCLPYLDLHAQRSTQQIHVQV
ncbi:hypothetical protein F5Y09DRAFT_301708, partial [Xylaria sp. FL1042]